MNNVPVTQDDPQTSLCSVFMNDFLNLFTVFCKDGYTVKTMYGCVPLERKLTFVSFIPHP